MLKTKKRMGILFLQNPRLMKFKLLTLLSFVLFTTQVAAQVTTNFSGTLTNSQTFKRPVEKVEDEIYTEQLTLTDVIVGTANYNYFVQSFTPAVTGSYSVTVSSATGLDDTFLIVYSGAFDPANPLTNFLRANDDINNLNAAGFLSSVTNLTLTAGTTYRLVLTSYTPGEIGTINFSVVGAGGVVVGNPPAITSATYNASTGVLAVTGTDFQAKTGVTNDIVLTNLTLTGEGGSTYTLTNATGIEITNATSFSTTLNATDKAAVNLILNKAGTSSTGATTYNLGAAAGWMANVPASADLTSNGVTVSSVSVPAITSATYDVSTGNLVVTGTGFLKLTGTTNDIVANKFTLRGQANGDYTLTNSPNPELTSGTEFTVVLSTTDKAGVNALLNKNGTTSVGGTTYNLAAAEDWAAGAEASVAVVDASGNGITVSGIASNTAPTDITLSASSINENVTAASTVGTLSATDAEGGAMTYVLVSGTGDTDNTAFTLTSGGSLSINASPDFETQSSYSVRVKVTDAGSLTYEKALTITITNVNEAPTDIALSSTSIDDGVAANSTVGTLSTTDVDAGNTFTYALATGTGATDNGAFNISGNSLRITNAPNYAAKNSYSVRIKTTDQGGLSYEKVFTISIRSITTFDFEANVTGAGNSGGATEVMRNVSQVKNGHTLNVASARRDLWPGTFAGVPMTGAECLVTDYGNSESSVTFSVAGGASFDLTAMQFVDIADQGETIVITTSKGSVNYVITTFTGLSTRNFSTSDSKLQGITSFTITSLDGNFYLGFDQIALANITAAPNNAPTDIALSASSINENVTAASTVGTLSTTDAEGGAMTYALVTGTGDTDNTAFTLTSGGSLSINASPNFETKSSYSIRVKVTDAGSLTYEKVLTITITNVNEVPTDIALSASAINENVIANSTVGALTTTDADASNTFTYTLVAGTGDTDNAAFNISGGNLRITASPDFETKSSYSVRVRTSDQGSLTFDKEFTITINNLNEAPTDLALSASAINENVAANSTVGALSTTDADASNTFTYTLVSGTGDTDNSAFNISGGNLRITASPDFETKSSYSVRVRTTDQGSLAFDKEFTITINNLNEAPTDLALSASAINENVAANSTVGALSTTDADASNTFAYTLVSGTGDTDNAAFTLTNGGSLSINASPNFETKSSYSVRIRTTDQGGLTYEKVFAITITNLNEAPTDLALSASAINENVAANSTVGALTTTDADASNTFTYTLVSGTGDTDNAAFNISGGNLRITASPDFETKSSYSVRVRTTDQGSLNFEKEFTITITNLNEAPTDLALSASAINENVAANSTVGALSTTDADASNTFAYTLVSGTGDTDNAAFTLTNGGSLSINASPNFETKSSYSVRIRTTDQGGLTYEKVFAITITNVNEAPTDLALSASAINENVAANSTVGALTTTDADASNTFTYTLVSGTGDTDNAAFNISGGNLRITASPDFETKSSYSVRVRTTDQGSLNFEKEFTITITNLNEAPTNLALSASAINENVAANSTVGALSTTDADASNTFTYTLVSGTGDTDNSAFNISGGNLRITASPDFETKSSYSVRVRTTDQGGLTYEKVFAITITNLNEAPTDLALSASAINENVVANSTVGALTTTDADASNTFTYTLVSGTGDTDNAAFNISGGNLRITASPDFETKSSYSVRVRVTDQGSLTYEKAFAITITNVNEIPTDLALSASSVNENAGANATIGALSTTDVDASNTFTYTLVSGTGDTDNSAFNISGGNLRITASPDFETKSSYSVRVRTIDQGGLTYEEAFNITITNLNEAPTDIALSASAINENVVANSTVGALSTTDADASNTFTYTLVSGTGDTDNSAFNISGGNLRITSSPNFEAKNSYTVRVRTTDQGGLTYEEAFSITIANVNEAPTDLALSASSINENVTANSTVGALTTTDVDASNTFTYTLVSGTGDTDNASFNISGGNLRITASPDFETKSSYSVRVRTTDQNGLTYEEAFAITITNVNEVPTDMALSASSINENVIANSTVGALTTTDVDASNTFTYTLVSGIGDTDNSAFNISGGNLRITASPNFETKNSYSVRVRTTDQGGLTYEEAFSITITNVNEAPTDIALSASSLNENVAANSAVGTLSSTDVDAASTFTYTLVSGTGDTDNTAFNISGNSLRITASPNFEAKNSYSVRVRTTDQDGLTYEEAFVISITNVNEAPTDIALSASAINENVVANSTVGILSSTDVDAANTFTYSLVSGVGSTDNGSFTISGNSLKITPSPDYETKNSYSIRVRTTDQNGLTYDKVFSIAINDVTELVFTTTTLNNATVAASYSQQINVTVGASPYSFAVTSGALPAGLTLSSTGEISGTPTAGGSFNLEITATDQNSVTGSYPYSLTVAAPTLALTASLTNGTVGTAYTQTVATTGGTSPYTYVVTIGSLPTGLTLSSAGAITGTPTTGGTFNFTVKATDASTGTGPYSNTKAYALVIDPAVQAITFSTTGTATYGDADFDPAATSTNSSINITYSSSDPTIATIVSSKVHILKAGTVTIYADQAANASYTAAVQKQQTLAISPKTLTVALTGTVSKTYNNNSSAVLTASNFSLTGKVGTDDVSIAAPVTGAYNNETVGIGKSVSVNSLALAGADQANYQLASTTANAAIGVILVKPITLTLNASPLVTKVYDRNTAAILAPLNYSLADIESGDDVAVSGITTYDNNAVGTGKVVTAGSFALSGTDKDNYSLTTITATTTGNITAKPITVALNAVPAITKVYDGNTIATLLAGNYTLTGLQVSDVVTVNGTANYDNRTVGAGKTVTVNSFVLAGADKDNYSLTTTTATTTGSVTAKPITLTLNATPVITKVYDNGTRAILAPENYGLAGLANGDDVAVTGTASYNDKTVGINKTVTAGSFMLSGTDKDNYNLTTITAATTGIITAKPITLALNATAAITKVYDGNATATLVAGNYTLNDVQPGDVVTVTGTANYENKAVGTGKTVTANTFILAGADKDNYSLTTTTANTTGSITAKPITLALNSAPVITKVYNGNNLATLVAGNYSLTGLISGDVITVTGAASYDNATANTGKAITVNTFVLAGSDKDNYNLTTTTASTTGTIAKASLAITAENKTRVQNTPNPSFTASYAGFVNSETNTVLTAQPTFSTTATLSSLQGDYPIVPAGASALNYNISYVNGTLTVTPGSPTSITLAQATLFENRPAATLTGSLSSTSDDPNATFTYTLVSGTGDIDNSLFAIAGAQLNTASSLNYEQKSSYSIRVRSTTQYGLSLDRVLTIALSDVNEQPTLNDIISQVVCANSDRQTLNLTGISAGPDAGQTTTLTISSNNAGLFSELSVSNAGVLNYRSATGQSGTATVTVTVKDNGGTANSGTDTFSRSFTITINPLPDLNIIAVGGKIELSKGESLVLRASGGATYTWAVSSGIIGARDGADLNIRPEVTTTYTVTATSASGCSISKSITISVKEDYVLVKGTNILSPNGDGKNDKFIIRNIDMYPKNEVKIFDRAGRLLFSKVNYTDQFDGTFQGSPLAEDTYYYIVDFGADKPKLKGFITIVRD
jgi:gliding motility-associated-like protein